MVVTEGGTWFSMQDKTIQPAEIITIEEEEIFEIIPKYMIDDGSPPAHQNQILEECPDRGPGGWWRMTFEQL
ncbi:uncharacterized protein G2W53_029743 [Senna tora]|uniref:Uncharacterized protein n=1 Tax=Senna tora TaxID=362788 RepID=A0A834TEM0_9FABA|nr:uncharacterized protein G2W53_029743 [Senna tora]